MRNMYYSDPDVIDLSKLREDASRRARGDKWNEAESVTIHFHSSKVPCEGKEHEAYTRLEVHDA